jgi:hypothetical protein
MPGRTVMEIVLPRLCNKKTAVENGRLADASQPFTA